MQPGVIHVLVGKEKKRFSIHKALEGSFPASALVASAIEDDDKAVFARCCEFVYTGDYSVPSPTSNPSGRDAGKSHSEEVFSRQDLG